MLWFPKKRCLLLKVYEIQGDGSNYFKDPLGWNLQFTFAICQCHSCPLMRPGFQSVLLPQSVCPLLPGGIGSLTASSSCLPWGNKAVSPWEASIGGSEEICLQTRDGRRTWKFELLLSSAHRLPFVLNLWHWNILPMCSYNICLLPWACWNVEIHGCGFVGSRTLFFVNLMKRKLLANRCSSKLPQNVCNYQFIFLFLESTIRENYSKLTG